MIAIDTNILVYAHRQESPHHHLACSALLKVTEGNWAIPWPCVHEFLSVVTNPKIFSEPTPINVALSMITKLKISKTLSLIGESPAYWKVLDDMLSSVSVCGPRIHDARIAAICLLHGVELLLTADRDFQRFPTLKTKNPLV